jgi:hypothetical protein
MADYTERFTEVHEGLFVEYPDNITPGPAISSGWIDMSRFHRVIGILLVGDMQANATVDYQFRQATSAAGAGAKAITGKAATQLTQAGGDGNDAVAIEVRMDELDVSNDFRYIEAQVTVGGNFVELAHGILGQVARYDPASTTFWTEVVD